MPDSERPQSLISAARLDYSCDEVDTKDAKSHWYGLDITVGICDYFAEVHLSAAAVSSINSVAQSWRECFFFFYVAKQLLIFPQTRICCLCQSFKLFSPSKKSSPCLAVDNNRLKYKTKTRFKISAVYFYRQIPIKYFLFIFSQLKGAICFIISPLYML